MTELELKLRRVKRAKRKFLKEAMKKSKTKKPKDFKFIGGIPRMAVCMETQVEIHMSWLDVKNTKRFHKWLGQAIKYLEQKK